MRRNAYLYIILMFVLYISTGCLKNNITTASDVLVMTTPANVSGLSPNNNSTDTLELSVELFTNSDNISLGIDLGASREHVEAVLGEPIRKETYFSYLHGGIAYTYHYWFGSVYFDPKIDAYDFPRVARIVISNSEEVNIRNCKIGMKYTEILSNFPNQNLGKNYFGEDILYISSDDIQIENFFGNFNGTGEYYQEYDVCGYGILGYYADGIRIGIVYVSAEEAKTRILQFFLENDVVISYALYYKNSEGARTHFYEYLQGTLSPEG